MQLVKTHADRQLHARSHVCACLANRQAAKRPKTTLSHTHHCDMHVKRELSTCLLEAGRKKATSLNTHHCDMHVKRKQCTCLLEAGCEKATSLNTHHCDT
eukprot:1154700-Pelagomonas_calceolata.AAC.2